MNSLGEKIKARRKQLQLTLKELAGDDFSYSLLSQIENNKANPSMETLHTLASKLGMPISELLNNQNYTDFKSLLKTCEKKFVMVYERNKEIDVEIKLQIEEVLESLTFQHYEEVRLIEIYCICTYYLEDKLPVELYSKVLEFYENIGNINKYTQAKLFSIGMHFHNKKYILCQQYIEHLATVVDENEHLVEVAVLLDFYNMKSLIESAIGDYVTAAKSIEEGISIAHSQSFYQKHVRFLQFSCFIYMQLQDHAKAFEAIEKFKHYVEFTDNIFEIGFYEYANFFIKNRLTSHSITEEITSFMEETKKITEYPISPIFTQELAFSHWNKKDYKKVIEILEQQSIPDHINHPLNVAGCLEIFAIRAYCYNKIGEREKAIEEIITIYQQMKDFPESTFKQSITNIYKELLIL